MNASPLGRRPAVIKRDQARLLTGQPPDAAAPHPAGTCAGELQVRIERSTESSTELRVTCPCGRTAVVVCEHDAAGGP